jgi:hypothetical protein
VLYAILGFGALGFLLAAWREIGQIRDLTHPEGVLVFNVLELVRGAPLYRDFLVPPYIHTPYGPLLYLLSLPGTVALGGSVSAAYVSGRVVVFLATGTTAAAIGFLTARLTASRSIGVLGGLGFLTIPNLAPWGYSMRPDLLAIALSVAGLALAWQTMNSRGLSWTRLTILAFLLLGALWSKQTAVGAPLAILLAWILRREWRLAGRLALLLGVAGLGLAILTQVWTGGAFFHNAFKGMQCNLRPGAPYYLLLHFAQFGSPLLVTALLGVGRDPRGWFLFEVYAATAVVMALLFALRGGSDVNHLIEPLTAVALLAGRGYAWLLGEAGQSRRRGAAIMLTCLVLFSPGLARTIDELRGKAAPTDLTRGDLLRVLAGNRGEILTFSTDLPLLSQRRPALMDPMIFACLADKGVWDPTPLASALRRGEIPTVVLLTTPTGDVFATHHGLPIWPPAVLQAIQERYRVQGQYGRQRVYAPEPGDRSPSGSAVPPPPPGRKTSPRRPGDGRAPRAFR